MLHDSIYRFVTMYYNSYSCTGFLHLFHLIRLAELATICQWSLLPRQTLKWITLTKYGAGHVIIAWVTLLVYMRNFLTTMLYSTTIFYAIRLYFRFCRADLYAIRYCFGFVGLTCCAIRNSFRTYCAIRHCFSSAAQTYGAMRHCFSSAAQTYVAMCHCFSSAAQTCCGQPVRPLLGLSAEAPDAFNISCKIYKKTINIFSDFIIYISNWMNDSWA